MVGAGDEVVKGREMKWWGWEMRAGDEVVGVGDEGGRLSGGGGR